jgi:hypothetical protein
MKMRTVQVPEGDVEVLRSLMLRSISSDQAALGRLGMLATAYADHVRGDSASSQLAQVRRRQQVARALLEQLGDP